MTAGHEYVESIGGSIGYDNGIRKDKDQRVEYLFSHGLILSPKDIMIVNESWDEGDTEQLEKVKEAGKRLTDMCRIQFEAVAEKNTRAKKKYGHFWLSFVPQDLDIFARIANEKGCTVNDVKLLIARDYMKEMGITGCQWYMVEHKGTSKPHFHITYNRIRPDGTCIDLGQYKAKNVFICEKLNKKYGLTPAGVEMKKNAKNYQEEGKNYLLYQLASCIHNCTNLEELKNELAKQGIEMRIFVHAKTNEPYGLTFCLVKEQMKFKASDLPAKAHFANILKILQRNANAKKTGRIETPEARIINSSGPVIVTNISKSPASHTQIVTGATNRDNSNTKSSFDILDDTEEIVDENGNVKKIRKQPIKM